MRESKELPSQLSAPSFEENILNNMALNKVLSGWESSKISEYIEPLILSVVYDVTHEEIAEVYGLSRPTITLRILKAREDLEDILKDEDMSPY